MIQGNEARLRMGWSEFKVLQERQSERAISPLPLPRSPFPDLSHLLETEPPGWAVGHPSTQVPGACSQPTPSVPARSPLKNKPSSCRWEEG